MPVTLTSTALNMAVALTCGAMIGSERQMRQRMAGLRTNALVAISAASFVIFSSLYPAEVSPTRVAAQVVSGIGFLGAGIIFRDGFNIHGLNTAATLWCSAAVGLMAGGGFWPYALMLTGFIIFINLGLRPLVKWIKRKTNAGLPITRHYSLTIIGPNHMESNMRALLLRTLGISGLHIAEIEFGQNDNDHINLTATVHGENAEDHVLEQAVAHLAAEKGLKHVHYQILEEG